MVRSADLVAGGAILWWREHPKNRCSLSSQLQQASNMWGCGGAEPRDHGSWERLSLGGNRGVRDRKAPARAALRALVGGPDVSWLKIVLPRSTQGNRAVECRVWVPSNTTINHFSLVCSVGPAITTPSRHDFWACALVLKCRLELAPL